MTIYNSLSEIQQKNFFFSLKDTVLEIFLFEVCTLDKKVGKLYKITKYRKIVPFYN